jgi:hypothetical protein
MWIMGWKNKIQIHHEWRTHTLGTGGLLGLHLPKAISLCSRPYSKILNVLELT